MTKDRPNFERRQRIFRPRRPSRRRMTPTSHPPTARWRGCTTPTSWGTAAMPACPASMRPGTASAPHGSATRTTASSASSRSTARRSRSRAEAAASARGGPGPRRSRERAWDSRSPPEARRNGWRRTATRPAVGQRVAVRAPHRLVDRRGRSRRSGVPGVARGASRRRPVPRRDRRGPGEGRVPELPPPPDAPAAPDEAPLPPRLIRAGVRRPRPGR